MSEIDDNNINIGKLNGSVNRGTVYFYTLGCRVNQYETDAVREQFIENGFSMAKCPEEADIVVVNTCTVTGEADRKSRQQIRRMGRISPQAVICAMGCGVEMTQGIVEADVICGTRDKNQLVNKVMAFLDDRTKQIEVLELSRKSLHETNEVSQTDEYHEFGSVLSPEETRAFIKVEDGCNSFCSYCIIPFARGRVCSRDEDNVIEEVKKLSLLGYHEIVLTGIHLCSYGMDRGEGIEALGRLIERTSQIDGIERIRLGSLEPLSLTKEFISSLKSIDKLCPNFHLSLQSGSDSVLKRMNRRYNTSEYADRVNMLRELFPDMMLSTDVICGFPGESDSEFEETCRFVEDMKFAKLHVFPYSVRKGTRAASMPQLSSEIAHERTAVLTAFSSIAEQNFASQFINREVEVLLEQNIHSNLTCGYTREYVKSEVSGAQGLPAGTIIRGLAVGLRDAVLQVEMKEKR